MIGIVPTLKILRHLNGRLNLLKEKRNFPIALETTSTTQTKPSSFITTFFMANGSDEVPNSLIEGLVRRESG
jgi:hypothetical protein